ncbi:hypothetical protein A2Z33_04070 [Candidatus Gottesmanbacteria bacterium RBG_16_52_11]|uniref:Uncharacterized protein n=1 Tax=Candidatus Gottesmanbacteria bacterium RBG_16_52_11 TaxID=1798374 RepID=A0A1F5YVS2_9BACT|nr:MAG: hypothetical protein A2Z33_04070 [Candidatus Gottesmanbacteria bacterium RBG_16_52_11]
MHGALILKPEAEDTLKIFSGVALDLEGTLVDLESLHHRAHREVAGALGITLPDSVDEIMRQVPSFVGGPDTAVMEQLLELARKNPGSGDLLKAWNVGKMIELKDAIFDGMFSEAVFRPREGSARLIQMVSQLGVPYTICSVTRSTQAGIIIDRSGLREMLYGNPVLLRHDVKHGKPSPDVYQLAAKEMNISPSGLLVFEDSPTGVKAAVAAGATVFAVPAVVGEGNKPTELMVKTLTESGAARVFDNWNEVVKYIENNTYIYLEGVRNNRGDTFSVSDAEGRVTGTLVKAFGAKSLLESGYSAKQPENFRINGDSDTPAGTAFARRPEVN